MSDFFVLCGDLRHVLPELDACTFDACVTDPPYELGFMGKAWDKSGIAFDPETWRAVWRVLKPGAHLVTFGGTRTWHRIAVAIEDAGFEIRDNLAWLYGQGFPKSLDIAKAFDRAAELPPEPATDLARKWRGWGTALKPSFEPIVLARKPLAGTVVANVQAYGVGGINVDGCREARAASDVSGRSKTGSKASENVAMSGANYARDAKPDNPGRWPPNVIADEYVAADLDQTYGTTKSGTQKKPKGKGGIWSPSDGTPCGPQYGDAGGVSRYFYCPKASGKERDAGLEHWPVLTGGEATDREDGTAGVRNPRAGAGRGGGRRNMHPTVKPIELMRWLCRLVTPPGGFILDPFTGSGTTGCAAALEGFDFVGVEREGEYARLASDRIAHWKVA